MYTHICTYMYMYMYMCVYMHMHMHRSKLRPCDLLGGVPDPVATKTRANIPRLDCKRNPARSIAFQQNPKRPTTLQLQAGHPSGAQPELARELVLSAEFWLCKFSGLAPVLFVAACSPGRCPLTFVGSGPGCVLGRHKAR